MRAQDSRKVEKLIRGLSVYQPEVEQLAAMLKPSSLAVLAALTHRGRTIASMAGELKIREEEVQRALDDLRTHDLARNDTVRDIDGMYSGSGALITRKGIKVRAEAASSR